MPHFLQLILFIALVLWLAKRGGALAVRLGQPAVVGKIALGLLLGPTLLDCMGWHIGGLYFFGGAHAEALLTTVRDLAGMGVLLLMFMAGLETEVSQVMRVGKAALWAAIGGVVAPMLSAFAAAGLFSSAGLGFGIYECLFIGTILSATSVSISAQTLMELGRLKGREGSAILGAAVIDDVVGIVILSLVIAFRPAGVGIHSEPEKLLDWIMLGLGQAGLNPEAMSVLRVLLLLLLMAGFFCAAIMIGRRLLAPLIKSFERLPVSQGLLAGTLLAGLMLAWAAEWIGGVAAITGTYICGVLLSRTALKEEVEEKLHALTYALFVPLFFVGIGLEANARPIFAPLAGREPMTQQEWLMLGFTLTVIVLAVLGKVLGCMLGARIGGFGPREAYRVGVGMISRGEVGIIVALVGYNAGIIDGVVFSVMVLMVLVTTLITPIWLKAAFREKSAPAGAERAPALPEE